MKIRIEPQWNVNWLLYAITNVTYGIRIEPQWNVNF